MASPGPPQSFVTQLLFPTKVETCGLGGGDGRGRLAMGKANGPHPPPQHPPPQHPHQSRANTPLWGKEVRLPSLSGTSEDL